MNKDSTLHDGHIQNLVMIPDKGIITIISAFFTGPEGQHGRDLLHVLASQMYEATRSHQLIELKLL